MNRKDFFEYVKDHVADYLPEKYEDAQIRLQEVAKKNGVTLTAMMIPEEGSNIMPNVYLDPFYQQYADGKDLDACVGDAADLWIEKKDVDLGVDIGNIVNYENVKDKLQVRLCDPDLNAEWLEGKAMTLHGDFAAYYTVNLTENGDGIASITVTEQMLDTWGIDISTLHTDAMAADKTRGPALYSMDEMIESMVFGGEEPENLFEWEKDVHSFAQPMFCMTNGAKMNGASLILHEDIRRQVGEFMQGDFFILPSSIHETLILPDNGSFDVHELNAMVKEINDTQVASEDRLSDRVQFCDGRTAVMENAEKREARIEKEKAAAAEKTAGKSGLHGKLEKAKMEIRSGETVGKPKAKAKDAALAM